MYEQLSRGIHIARKPHRCESCGKEISPGSVYHQRVYKWEGDFVDEKLHPWCAAELEWFFSVIEPDDGFYFEDIQDFVWEQLCWWGYFPRDFEGDPDEYKA